MAGGIRWARSEQLARTITVRRALGWAAVVLSGKVLLSVVRSYPDYFPPNFDAEFLLGRERYFWGAYAVAFYAHVIAGPLSLLAGLVLMSGEFRQRFPRWHRRLGHTQTAGILLLVVPSGLVMARHALTGAVAAVGLATLAIATAGCVGAGWRAAVQRRLADHQQWMWRTFLLLSSAVVLRLIGGLSTALAIDALWVYPASCWLSWLAPLAAYEIQLRARLPVPLGGRMD